MYRMEKFSDFIVEQKDEAYKLIVFNNSTEKRRDVGDTANYEFNLLINSAKKVGIELYNVDYVGLHISEDNGKLFLNSFEFDKNGEAILPKENGEKKYQKPIEINPKNTLLFARGLGTYGYTANRRYVDYIRLLEDKGFKTIPSVKTWDLCSSKYYCDKLFMENGLRTPKTLPITYSDDTERVYLAWITDISSGDQITASYYAYDINAEGEYPKQRIWAHWTDNADIDSYDEEAKLRSLDDPLSDNPVFERLVEAAKAMVVALVDHRNHCDISGSQGQAHHWHAEIQ